MFRISWQVWIGEIGKKDNQNSKKRKKKQIVNDRIFEEFWNSNIYIFQKNILWFSKILWENL